LKGWTARSRTLAATFALCAVLLSGSAGAARGKMDGNTYVSPRGHFRCAVAHYDLGEVEIKDAFEKGRGSVAFNDFFDITRVDVEDYEHYVDPATLSAEQLEHVHASYFDARVVPLVKMGVKDAVVLSRQFTPGGSPTYASVMRLPARDGEHVRAAVQFTNGHSMYVVSVLHPTRPELGYSMQREADDILKIARAAFDHCQFPAPGAEGKYK